MSKTLNIYIFLILSIASTSACCGMNRKHNSIPPFCYMPFYKSPYKDSKNNNNKDHNLELTQESLNYISTTNQSTTITNHPDLIWAFMYGTTNQLKTKRIMRNKFWKYYPAYLPPYRKFTSRFKFYNEPARKTIWHPTKKGIFLALGTNLLFIHNLCERQHIFAQSNVINAKFVKEDFILIQKETCQELWDFEANKKIQTNFQTNGDEFTQAHCESISTYEYSHQNYNHYFTIQACKTSIKLYRNYRKTINIFIHIYEKNKNIDYKERLTTEWNLESTINDIALSPDHEYFLVSLEDGRIEFFQRQNQTISLKQGYLITKYLEYHQGSLTTETWYKISNNLNISLNDIIQTWNSINIEDRKKIKELVWSPNS